MPENGCILVREIDSVTTWYVKKLGLYKAGHVRLRDYDVATYKFKEDGKSITLTTRLTYGTAKLPRLFTKRIGRMQGVLSARGIDVGSIQQDRQGTRYFEIQDPEGNVIEVVQES
jgi:predicted enzyme related to lactoylglutathione lyase